MKNVKWIFFDVGSTLIDEAEAYNHRIRDMIAGTNIRFEEFDRQRIRFAKDGLNGDSEAIRHFGLSKTPWHSEDEVPYADTEDALSHLRSGKNDRDENHMDSKRPCELSGSCRRGGRCC